MWKIYCVSSTQKFWNLRRRPLLAGSLSPLVLFLCPLPFEFDPVQYLTGSNEIWVVGFNLVRSQNGPNWFWPAVLLLSPSAPFDGWPTLVWCQVLRETQQGTISYQSEPWGFHRIESRTALLDKCFVSCWIRVTMRILLIPLGTSPCHDQYVHL
jgi:hypothetical protein